MSSSYGMGSGSSSSRSRTDLSTITNPNIQALRALYSRFHLKCRRCNESLSLLDPKEHVESWMAAAKCIPPKSQISQLYCKKCPLSTCAGCGGDPTLSKNMTFTPFGVLDHCCQGGRLFSIWFLLAIFDEDELKQKKATPSPKKATSHPKGSKKKLAPPSGVGYSGSFPTHPPHLHAAPSFGAFSHVPVDYDSDEMEEMMQYEDEMMMYGPPVYLNGQSRFESSSLKDTEEDESPDTWMTTTLALLTAMLTTTTPDSGTDELLLFRLSFLLDRVTDLMRNDSISELTQRRDLYDAVFLFLWTISNNFPLVQLIFEPRADKRGSPGLRFLSDGLHNDSIKFTTSRGNLSTSLFACSSNTYRQAQVFLKLANKSEQSSKKASFRLCNQFVKLYDSMEKKATKPDPSVIENTKDPWTTYAEENRVTFTDEVLKNHHYQRSIVGITAADSHRGRLNTIGKEIANMTTSLPVGIFLKVADSRTDIMKALIVGVEGTPYAGGLFVFDIFLDANYPISPPKVAFVLQGNETNMNPNLHPGGSVCLSILNTWEGAPSERWQPNKSTILSVLVSIQAMILGAPLPFLNEPGFEHQGETARALQYNLDTQCKTVRYAMIYWLKNLQSKDRIWKEVSEIYWKCHGQQVFNTVQEWAEGNSGLLNYNPRAIPHSLHHPIHPHHPPKKSKGKAKETVPEVAGENLLDMLSRLLGMALPESESGTSTNNKGKRKAQNPGSSIEAKRLQANQSRVFKWVYSGDRSMKGLRAAFDDIGMGAARSIKESIERLESHVQNYGLESTTWAEKHGVLMEVGEDDDGEDVD